MVVIINEHYKLEIDKAKTIVVNEDYTLKSPYFFIGLYFLSIFYNSIQLSNGIHFMVIVVYTLPMFLGTIYELYKIAEFKKSSIDLKTIKRVMRLGYIRVANILIFMFSGLFMFVQAIAPELLKYLDFVNSVSALLILVYIISIVFSFSVFLLGIVIEKKQAIEHKKKWFAPSFIIGGLAVVGYFILRESSYSVLILMCILGILLLSYGLGKTYFRYKNFDKKISNNDKMIDYKL